MWDEFFYFSKSERRAIFFLLAFIVICLSIAIFVPEKEPEWSEEDKAAIEDIKRFVANLKTLDEEDSIRFSEMYSRPLQKQTVELSAFEPNLADSNQLLRLGLPRFIVRNILKYRAAGGKFRTADDFSRIYGLSEETFQDLKPYIYISEAFQRKAEATAHEKPVAVQQDSAASARGIVLKQFPKVEKYPEGTKVALNDADTTELKKIPGIGSGIARAIVAYREKLGGFYETAQLRDIAYVSEEMLQWFTLGNSPIRPLYVNRASLERLRAHPYLNFYQAKVIVEHRRKQGKIKSLSQLSLYEEFTEKDLERLSPYLSFSEEE